MEFGIPFTLAAPNGVTLEFNQAGSPYLLQNVDGLDGSALRSRVDELPSRDGGILFPPKRGPLYPTLKGVVLGNTPADIHVAAQALRAAMNSMRPTYGLLSWVHSDGTHMQIAVVMADRVTFNGFEFLAPMVCPTSVKFGPSVHTQTFTSPATSATPDYDAETLANGGDADVFPFTRVHGPCTAFRFYNATTDDVITFSGTVASGHYLDIDWLEETIYLDGDTRFSKLGYLNNGDYFPLVPGVNVIEFSATWTNSGPAPTADASWRDAYA